MRFGIPLVLLTFLSFNHVVLTQTVVTCSRPGGTLAERWSWVREEFRRISKDGEVWAGYSIQRLMDENSYIGSRHSSLPGKDAGQSLRSLITGKPDGARVVGERREFRPESRITKVLKDIAILVKISETEKHDIVVRAIRLNDLDLAYDQKTDPLIWLGDSKDEESVRLLAGIFDEEPRTDVRKKVVQAIGIHPLSGEAVSFLKKTVRSDAADDVRAEAVFWLTGRDDTEGLRFLRDVIENDRALRVREQAVFALSRFDSDESTNELIDIARNSRESKVRSKAAFWLGQKASEKATSALNDIVVNDVDTDVQRQAVFALAQLKRGEGVEYLIKIAQSHHNMRVRKEAIRLLGQSTDERALNALAEFLRSK